MLALVNLSLSDRDKTLWSTLVGAGFGYLVPNPTLKRRNRLRENESLYHDATEQQLDDSPPVQHGIAIHD